MTGFHFPPITFKAERTEQSSRVIKVLRAGGHQIVPTCANNCADYFVRRQLFIIEQPPQKIIMKIIVNSGNIGTPVAVELAKAGAQVTLTVRAPKANAELDKLGIRQVTFDINSVESMTSALKGGDAFFSLTPLVENLVEAGNKAVQAAKAAGIKKIVRSSAQGAGPGAEIDLGRWHYAVEKAVEDSGIPFTILRPANFMQNYLNFGTPETIKAQGAFYSPLGDAKVSPVDTRDISSVAAKVLVESGHEGKRYDLTGGESLSNAEIAELFSKALGRKISHISIPETAASDAMAKAGTPPWLVHLLTELNAVGKAGYLAAVKPDAEVILKRKPITFAKFIQDHLAVFKS
jgi:uncharacterized protein YbjT (DUF2867 family)